MMPMLTFDWNILSFTVVYDSQENCKTAYKKVTAYQGSKGSQIHEVTMRDHNGDEVFHPHQSKASPLTIKYHYPVIEMTVTDSNTLPTNTNDNLPLYTNALQFQILHVVTNHINKLILNNHPSLRTQNLYKVPTCPSLLHDATVMRHQDRDLLRYTASTGMIDLGKLEKKINMMSS